MSTHDLPRVGVVIATRNRPALVRRAIDSVLDQHYASPIEIAVVFDRSEPDWSLVRADPQRRVTVMVNDRTPGLAGARNTGILSLTADIVAFCDDDDMWLPGKLAGQVERLASRPHACFVATAMRVDYGDRSTVRLVGLDRITVDSLIRSRMAMLHSSSFLFRRQAMLGPDGFGLIDETMPRSMAEDWDLLLRAARHHPIEIVDEPLVAVLWGQSSYFNDSWLDKNAAHEWLIERYPEFGRDRKALAFMVSKLAFGHAALGERAEALRCARRAMRLNWRESRTPFALLVVLGVPARSIVVELNKRGHGI